MKPDDDDALRAAFADAHRRDAEHLPSFNQVWRTAHNRQRPSSVPWLLTCASLVAAAGLAVWLVGHLGPPPAQLPGGTTWRGPTDFLLETPGLITLRTVPNFPVPVLRQAPNASRGNP
jgi:hypothetical protein